MDSTIYFEVFILIDVLFSYVLRDHVVRDVSRTTAEVATRPQVPSPELLLQVRELGQQMMRRSALEPLHQSADGHLRRQRDQQVHVISRYMPLHDRHLMLPADIPDQIAHPRRNLALQCWPPVLRDPHQMQVDFKYSVRAPPVFRHPRSLSGAHALKAVA